MPKSLARAYRTAALIEDLLLNWDPGEGQLFERYSHR